jgi:hypothetical protein
MAVFSFRIRAERRKFVFRQLHLNAGFAETSFFTAVLQLDWILAVE